MPATVDRRPRYLQAVEALMNLLDSSYESGALLPSADQLAQQIGVSRSTLREAMSYLERDGRLIRKQGVGTFVAKATQGHLVNRLEQLSGLRNLATAAGLPMEIAQSEVIREQSAPDWVVALDADASTPIFHIHIVVSIDACRVAYFESCIAAEKIDAAALAARKQTMFEYLLTAGPVLPSYTDSRIEAVKADEQVAGRLGIALGDAVLKMTEVFYSDEGRQILYQHAYLLTETLDYRLVRRVVRESTGR